MPGTSGRGLGTYLGREGAEGRWFGLACERFGVQSGARVLACDFEALEQNRHPVTLDRVTERMNTTRKEWVAGEGGELECREVPNRVGSHHFVFGCPKSGSVWGVLEDGRWKAWHSRAVYAALSEMERMARVQEHGQGPGWRATGRLAAAVYDHEMNACGEPHLHSHVVALNMTSYGERNLAVDAKEWYRAFAFFTEVYRSSLAADARDGGYALEWDRHGAPQVKGSESLIKTFSGRTAQLEELTRLAQEEAGLKLNAYDLQPLTLASAGLDLDALKESLKRNADQFESWKTLEGEAAEKGENRRATLQAFTALVRAASSGEKPPLATPERVVELRGALGSEDRERLDAVPTGGAPQAALPVEGFLGEAIRHVFSNRSLAQPHEVLTAALKAARGQRVELGALRTALETSADVIHNRDGSLTTPGHLDRELELVRWVKRGKGGFTPVLAGTLPERLNENQRQVIKEVLDSSDQFMVLRGLAGTGKSSVCAPLAEAYLRAGHHVAALAPSNAARDNLKSEGFPEASNLSLFLSSPSVQAKLKPGDVVMLDEAGMASVTQVHALMRVARVKGARVLFVGDSRQHVSVEAGDALRLLLRRTDIRSSHLYRIVRQRPDAMNGMYLRAAKLFARGLTTKAFAQLDAVGGIVEMHGKSRLDALADAYVQEVEEGRTAVIVNPTHRENDAVNAAVRVRRFARGELTDDRVVESYRSLGWSESERARVDRIPLGHVVEITRGTGKGDAYVVTGHGPKGVRGVCGKKERWFEAKHASHFDVCAPQTLRVAIGDELITRAGVKTRHGEVINGERVTVVGFTPDGHILSKKGQVVTTKNLAHAYAVTSNRSQSGTWDTALVGLDETSVGFASQKLAYVAGTRGRTRLKVFVANKAMLTAVGDKPGDRPAATDARVVRDAAESRERKRLLDDLERLQRETKGQAYPSRSTP